MCSTQYIPPRTAGNMAKHASREADHTATNGHISHASQDMLRQICAKSRASRDTRIDSRSKSMFRTNLAMHVEPHTDRPQRPEQNETSIALIPRGHPLLSLQNLEAEASGLLDRLLGIFQDHTLYVHKHDASGSLLTPAVIPL